MSEQLRILEMIEKGQITAADGMALLEALNGSREHEAVQNHEIQRIGAIRDYKFFKIKVTSENNTVRVNVNVPIRLLSTIGEMTSKMTSMIPADARKEMEDKGIDITSMDFAKIIEEILNGTLENPDIVDIEAWDESHKTMIKVKIYVE